MHERTPLLRNYRDSCCTGECTVLAVIITIITLLVLGLAYTIYAVGDWIYSQSYVSKFQFKIQINASN